MGLGASAPQAAQQKLALSPAQQATSPPPDQPGTHAKLLGLIQGGLVGLGAMGKAFATHGREGGVQEVVNIQQQQSQEKRAAEDQDMRRKAFATNQALNELKLEQARQAAPTEQAQRLANLQQTKLNIAKELNPKGVLIPDDPNDPTHGQAVLQYAKANGGMDKFIFDHQDGVGTFVTKRADIFGKVLNQDQADAYNGMAKTLGVDSAPYKAGMSAEDANDLLAVMQGKLHGQILQSQATQEQAKAGTAGQMAQLDVTAKKAQIAQTQTATAVAQKQLQSTTADDMAQQLVDGNLDPSQLSKRTSKGSDSYNNILSKANQLSMQQSGKPFNVAQASLDYNYSKNPQTQSTLKMIDGMTEKGGSIDIAQNAAKALPQFNSPTVNKIFNAAATGFGSAEATNFHTAMLGLADEYSKVMGGGVSSDTGRQQSLDLLKDAYSKGQLAGAVDIMRKDISARKQALVGDNRYLQRQYPQTENFTHVSGSGKYGWNGSKWVPTGK